ncbi:hypothetical protein O7608_27920 [Solwaraspora sp. WMMA2056]|uniref:hypothetical protein n=1 Tax=Solwaraspora sp. WMMA2056 TaxID=3015161 RepID=UPI00259B35A7|nr:hypothetical protein [Solwaraspora sp. WMMA2056]WJK40199.1 hypothetical protein O7608_27920 [Solwaraspora sp. WMMA2056]
MSDDSAEAISERVAAVGKSPLADNARQPIKITESSTNTEIVQRLKISNRSAGPSTSDIVEVMRNSRR